MKRTFWHPLGSQLRKLSTMTVAEFMSSSCTAELSNRFNERSFAVKNFTVSLEISSTLLVYRILIAWFD